MQLFAVALDLRSLLPLRQKMILLQRQLSQGDSGGPVAEGLRSCGWKGWVLMEALRGYFCISGSVIRIKRFQAAVTRYWVAYRLIKTASEKLLLPRFRRK